jgi:hypothetical protein
VRCVAADGRLGTPWRARRRAASWGTEPGLGRGRRDEGGEAGVGAAAVERRPGGALRRRQEKQSRAARARGRREGRVSGGPVWKFQEFQGPLGKERFPTDVGV